MKELEDYTHDDSLVEILSDFDEIFLDDIVEFDEYDDDVNYEE